ncbi:carbamate kinase [Lutibacter sp. B2]|nr:carbamate kinase [Lutibacter sp. B2]
MKRIVVALGGNALQSEGKPATAKEQLEIIKKTSVYLVDIIEEGYELIIAHGNGPQVGRLLLQNEASQNITPAMPFDVCGAMSQGMIGYHVQQAIGVELKNRGINTPVVTLITQVVVDKNDEAFRNPTKPIGPFYTKEEALILKEKKGYDIVEDAGRGYRRVVPSPMPKKIVEIESINTLMKEGQIVITVGGGGIPVIEEEEKRIGVAAVIDKDLASERLAEDIEADILLILTAVEKIALNFGKPNQRLLDKMNIEEADEYIKEGQFAPGSMLPKVKAAVTFAKSKEGRTAIIASLHKAKEALEGKSGTVVEM